MSVLEDMKGFERRISRIEKHLTTFICGTEGHGRGVLGCLDVVPPRNDNGFTDEEVKRGWVVVDGVVVYARDIEAGEAIEFPSELLATVNRIRDEH